jgi:adenosylmethionine-8-amino-7-oxononanoate aminotransferase
LNAKLHPLARLDRQYVWHPFTQMQDWLEREPIVLVRGKGSVLWDARGRSYLDANSSIWTNLHGHGHPQINAALRRQLGRVAHTSALGFANEPSAQLAEALVRQANPLPAPGAAAPTPALGKVFYSDNGSTALEVALKLAHECARREGRKKPRFLSLAGAYHGDTIGAVSLGHIDLFHRAYQGLLFKADPVMAPYCYRCPFNRAQPERADAREYRRCEWECVREVERKFSGARRAPYSALVVEPLMQGAAGLVPQPAGWLRRVAELARAHGARLIADEVMTGFGRTGVSAGRGGGSLFACHQEGVQPDFLCLAKGLTGGYLPMAATLTTQAVFDQFLGEYGEFKTFFHGHSFTGNQMGAAAALASLRLLAEPASVAARRRLQAGLRRELAGLWPLAGVGDIRQVGLVAGVELVRDWRTREPFDLRERAGIRVCEALARRGVLTRPVGNVIVLMPPYCTTPAQLRRMVGALHDAIAETFPGGGP